MEVNPLLVPGGRAKNLYDHLPTEILKALMHGPTFFSKCGQIILSRECFKEEAACMCHRPIKSIFSVAPVKNCRAKPRRTEPSQAEPRRAEASLAGPSRAGPGRAEPSRSGPGRAEPSRAEPSGSGPGRAETAPDGPRTTLQSQFLHPRGGGVQNLLMSSSHMSTCGSINPEIQHMGVSN